MIIWKQIYLGKSEKIQRQIAVLLHQAGIPYRLSGGGLYFIGDRALYSVSVRKTDLALALLVLKSHRKKR